MHDNLGCWFENGSARFRVWAPAAKSVELMLGDGKKPGQAMAKEADGTWLLKSQDLCPGDRYAFKIDGSGPFPDPVSRFQPDGVHGFSQAMDLTSLCFQHPNPPAPAKSNRIIYELHVGTFTPDGTYDAAREKLGHLRDLGVTLVELMPLADFPGRWNWGYDGVSLFAPARCYGSPKSLAAFVDAAHGLGMGVLLDVVYNHLGPDGNYLSCFSRDYFHAGSQTPWGDGVNLTAPGNDQVRAFFLANARQWLRDYRFDGLRLDATHALNDDDANSFLKQLATTIHGELPDREILIYAEDHRNPNHFCLPESAGGFGLDGVWADDWHHHMRRHVTGDKEGYFEPFLGSLELIASTLNKGWHRDGHGEGFIGTGSDPKVLNYENFVICLQNHDQIGNRAFGERLHHQIKGETFLAASALLLLAPETPLLFMGQEWGSQSPFQFFTDHKPDLGKMVTEGRRREFSGFSAFRDPEIRERIPDPQSPETFRRSKLDWQSRDKAPHAQILAWHRKLLALRRTHPATQSTDRAATEVAHIGEDGILLYRMGGGHLMVCLVCLKAGGGLLDLPWNGPATGPWSRILTSEDQSFAISSANTIHEVYVAADRIKLEFQRPGAWIAETNLLVRQEQNS